MWWETEGYLAVKENRLQFGGRDVVDLLAEHGTPTYLYDMERIVRQYERLRSGIDTSDLTGVEIKYALKANNHPKTLETIKACGAGIDATSPNELRHAREHGFTDDEIVFTGTALSDEDLTMLHESDVLVNFDSVSSLRRFEADPGRAVGLRINSGIGLGRSEKTTTGGEEANESLPVKFGIPHNETRLLDEAFEIIEDRGYRLRCLHHHVGSDWLGEQALQQEPNYLDALDNLLSVATRARERGHTAFALDLGGGFGTPHRDDEEPFPVKAFFDAVAARLANTPVSELFVEPGTSLVSPAGIFCTTVTTVERKNDRTFVGVDAGLNSFNSPAQYDYYHEAVVPGRVTGDSSVVTVAGNNCESGDLFAVDRSLPTTVREGDRLVFLNAGAYGAVFRSEFNLRDPAAEVVVRNASL